ncbi:hypothetical protein HY734_02430 [Candidatus Uhrbacteria bacterium]|nr:hypothetical protein [Candidatus Uhrbacteria bacterium]
MKLSIPELLGWYGVVAILLAYVLLTFSVLESQSLAYHLLNASGAVGIVVDAVHQKNWQPAVLNIIWLVIAAIAVGRIVF